MCKEIPDLDYLRKKLSKTYSTKINFNHKKINEGVVDIRTMGISGDNYYFHRFNPPYYKQIKGSIIELLTRISIAEKLVKINKRLLKYGLELYVLDSYRPTEVQQFLYDRWYPKYLSRVFPNLNYPEILIKRDMYVAKAYKSSREIDRKAPPPHSTGAAVDITLRSIESKDQLFMGTVFDDVGEIVHTDFYEKIQRQRLLTLSEESALKHRRLLYWSMLKEGFVNWPDEWWHYSYGDQMWATMNYPNEAFYSNLDL